MNNASLELGGTNWAEKEGSLLGYAVNDTNNKYSAKEFTFGRGTNLSATRIGQTGLIEKGRENLLLQSNQFDTTWIQSNVSVTSGQTGYDGSSDAWLLEVTATGSYRRVHQSGINLDVNTFSIYAKANTSNFLFLLNNKSSTDAVAFFDLSNGSIGGVNAAIDTKIESVGNGWYRCSITSIFADNQYYVSVADGISDVTATAGASLYIQDAQIEQGLAASPYIQTTTTAAQAGVLENTPRLNYTTGVANPYLLLEPSRTNQIENSEYYGAYISTALSVSSNQATSPEGLQNASALIEDNADTNHFLRIDNLSWTSGTDVVLSIYLKENTRRYARLRFDNSGGNTRAWLDLRTGETTFIDAGAENGVCTSTDVGNGWFRYEFKVTPTNTGVGSVQVFTQSQESIAGNLQTFYQGDGTSGIYVWGAQVETATYPTSYIPTYSVSATRAADTSSKADASADINSTEGVLYAEIAAFSTTGSAGLVSLNNGTTSNRVTVELDGANIKVRFVVGGSSIGIFNYATTITETSKIAAKYKANDFALWVNGTEQVAITSGSSFSSNTLNELSFDRGDGNEVFNGKLNALQVYKEALTDTELATLTTI